MLLQIKIFQMIELTRSNFLFYYKNSSINRKNINKIKNNLDNNNKLDIIKQTIKKKTIKKKTIKKKTIKSSSEFKITKQNVSFVINFTEI